MFLSRLTLDGHHSQVRQDLRNCHELHRTLLSGFPDAPKKVDGARAHFGLLYRREPSPISDAETILAQSVTAPDWSRLPPGYCKDIEIKEVRDFYARIANGGIYRFRLRANPTRKTETMAKADRIGGKPKHNGKRRQMFKEVDQIKWLRRKADQGGFSLLSVKIGKESPPLPAVFAGSEGVIKGKKKITTPTGPTKKIPITLFSVLFEGRLQIANSDLFRKTLQEGIGSGKAYGFGLLSIAPL